MAYDAIIELTGSEGKRLVPIEEFYLGAKRVDLRPDEIQTCLLYTSVRIGIGPATP